MEILREEMHFSEQSKRLDLKENTAKQDGKAQALCLLDSLCLWVFTFQCTVKGCLLSSKCHKQCLVIWTTLLVFDKCDASAQFPLLGFSLLFFFLLGFIFFFFYILSYQMSMNTRFALQTFFFFCRSCFLLELYSSFWMEDDWKRRQGLSTGKAWFRLCRSTDRKCSKEPSETVNHLLYHPGMTARLFQVYIALGRHQKVNIENTNVALRSMISLCLYHTAVCKCYVFTNKQLDFF